MTGLRRIRRVWLGAGLWATLALPPVRGLLEASMVGHMGVQIPLLIAAGWLVARGLPDGPRRLTGSYNGHGVPGIVLTLFAVAYWMLPRNLDGALEHGSMELVKFASLPLLAGVPLALSWPCLPLIGRGIIWSNLLAMLLVTAWLYLESPVRICNFYLFNQQTLLGWYWLTVGGMLALALIVRAFTLDLHARSDVPPAGRHERPRPHTVPGPLTPK